MDYYSYFGFPAELGKSAGNLNKITSIWHNNYNELIKSFIPDCIDHCGVKSNRDKALEMSA